MLAAYTALVFAVGVMVGLLIGILADAADQRRARLQRAADVLSDGDVRSMRRYCSDVAIREAMEGAHARDRPGR